MTSVANIVYRFRTLRQGVLWGCLSLLSGCIREDRDNCLSETADRFVVLKVVDAATGRDITETGQAGRAELYLFSSEKETFVERISVSEEQIMHHVPILLPGKELDRCHISVWANAGTGQRFHQPSEETLIGGRAVSLIEGADEYHGTPDDLFFGHIRLAATEGTAPEEIIVGRKNARMHVTVRGLDRTVPEERYYFTVRIPNDGYDFTGTPAAGQAVIYRTGRFDAAGDFSPEETFNLIHTDPAAPVVGEVTVSLYERASVRSADRLVVSTANDENGRSITLPAGRTFNLLIELGNEAGIVIRTEVTPWDEVYQWEIW